MSLDFPADLEALAWFLADIPAEAMHQTEDDFCMWPFAKGRLEDVLHQATHAGVDPNDVYISIDGGVWRYLRTIKLAER